MPQAESTAATRGTTTRVQLELAGDFGRVQPRCAAKGEQRELPGVDAAAHRDEPHPSGHRGVDDAMDALRRREPADPESCGDTVDRGLGGSAVEMAPAAEKARRIEIAEHQVGVGDGRRVAAGAVAGGTGNRAGALRADMQDAAGIDPGDRAAAGADAGDVEAVERDRVAGDPAAGRPGSAGPRRSARCRCWSRPCRTGSDCPPRTGAPHRRCRRRRRPGRRAPRRRPAGRPRRSARPRHATG